MVKNYTKFELKQVDGKLHLVANDKPQIQPICIDFNSGNILQRIKDPTRFKSSLSKAIKIKSLNELTILDATAGFGKDAFLMAEFGAKVTLIEKNKLVYKLLQDGINRAKHIDKISEIIGRMELHSGDAIKLIPALASNNIFNIIYLDPMFTGMKLSPQPKKEFMVLRELIERDDGMDANKLLEVALEYAKNKVVVKRHKLSPYLLEKKPQHSYLGKTNRFDVYFA